MYISRHPSATLGIEENKKKHLTKEQLNPKTKFPRRIYDRFCLKDL